MTSARPDSLTPVADVATPSGVRATRGVSLPPICQFGRYDILGRVALGGMAEIFLARERASAGATRMLVIKRVLQHVADDPRFVQMFLDEARLAMHLRHPNICHIYEFGEEAGSYFIAMEWVEGVPLGQLIKRARQMDGAVTPAIAARIIAATAEALDYAHHACDETGRPMNVVHRDVSPQNIMASYDGGVKLLDFGIAKAETHATKTSIGQVKGKFAYMSPQQCVGDPIDGRADVFALGVCLYEALTARNLYRRSTEYETMRAIIEAPVPSIRTVNPALPEALEAIVQQSLAKDPADRFASAGEMAAALDGWLASTGEVVNAATLNRYLGRLFEEERNRGPLLDAAVFTHPMMSSHPPPPEPTPAAGKRWGWAVAASMLLLTVALGIAGLVVWGPWRHEVLGPEHADSGHASNPGRATTIDPVATATPSPAPDPAMDTGSAGSAEEAFPWEAGGIAATSFGSVAITSDPPGANIQLGDETLDARTPHEVRDLAPGRYPLTIRRSGYRTWRGTVDVVAGEVANARAELEEPPPARVGSLSINTQPWSRVYVGGRLLGTTPIGRVSLPAGPARLRLVDRDGNTHERTVQIGEGEHAREFFDLGHAE